MPNTTERMFLGETDQEDWRSGFMRFDFLWEIRPEISKGFQPLLSAKV